MFPNFDQFQPVSFKVDLQTTKYVHFWNQRAICNQKKYHIDIKTSNFDLHMKIFNLQGLEAPDKPKKKYAEIDFTSHLSFLRLKKVKKLPHTKKNPAYCVIY
jgi:hypothetical protein